MFGKQRQTEHLPDLVSTQEHFSSSSRKHTQQAETLSH